MFNQSAATAKTRFATKIICNCFAFLVSFLRLLRLFAAIYFCRYSCLPLLADRFGMAALSRLLSFPALTALPAFPALT